jgi:pimeloyl-ACP methyl ester carboxylesterase
VSDPDQAYLSYDQLEELVVRKLPVAGKYVIIAESFSGPIALQIANRAYGDLEVIALVSSFAYRPLGWKGSVLARVPLNLIFRLPLPDFILRTVLLGGSASADDLDRARQVISQVRPHVLVSRLREALTSDYGKHQIPTSVRVIAVFAEYDHLLGHRSRQSLAEVCPKAEIEIVSAPHFAVQTAPTAVLRALRKRNVLP